MNHDLSDNENEDHYNDLEDGGGVYSNPYAKQNYNHNPYSHGGNHQL